MAADLWKKPSRNSASHHGGGRAQGANEIHGRLEWWSWPGGRDTIELLAGIHRRFPRTSAEYRPGLLNPSLSLSPDVRQATHPIDAMRPAAEPQGLAVRGTILPRRTGPQPFAFR